MPLKDRGKVSGSFSSPRAAMKMRFGDSANTPGCDPQMYPCFAQGNGHLSTTSYGPVSSSPPFSCRNADDEKNPRLKTATTTSSGPRIPNLVMAEPETSHG